MSGQSNPIEFLNIEDFSSFDFNSTDFGSVSNVNQGSNQDDLALFMNNDFYDYENANKKSNVQTSPSNMDFLNSFNNNGVDSHLLTSSLQNNLFETTQFGNNEVTVKAEPEEEENVKASVTDLEKKRRNTAASARFRIKKKLREKEMEIQTKNLVEKVSKLNTKIKTLEMENKCLKKLIIDKNKNSESKSNYELLQLFKSNSDDGFTIASV